MFVSGTTTNAQQGTGTGMHFQNFVVSLQKFTALPLEWGCS